MEIIDKKEPRASFGKLSNGTCFRFDACIWLKVDKKSGINVVCLTTNRLSLFHDSTQVITVESTLEVV